MTAHFRTIWWLLGLWTATVGGLHAQTERQGWLNLYDKTAIINQVIADGDGDYIGAGGQLVGGQWRALLFRLTESGDTLWVRQFRPNAQAVSAVVGEDNRVRVLTLNLSPETVDSLFWYQFEADGTVLGQPVWAGLYDRQTNLRFPNIAYIAPDCYAFCLGGTGEATLNWLYADGRLRRQTPLPGLVQYFDLAADTAQARVTLLGRWDEITNQYDVALSIDSTGAGLARWEMPFFGPESRYGRLTSLADGRQVALLAGGGQSRMLWLSPGGAFTTGAQTDGLIDAFSVTAPLSDGNGVAVSDRLLSLSFSEFWIRRFQQTFPATDTLRQTLPGFEQQIVLVNGLIPLHEGRVLLYGQIAPDFESPNITRFIAETDEKGQIFYHLLEGRAVGDANGDCMWQTGEPTLPFVKFEIRGENEPYTATYLANADGRIYRQAGEGLFTVRALAPNHLWESCLNTPVEIFSDGMADDTTRFDWNFEKIRSCPFMQVDLGTPELRCGNNIYHVQYWNAGSATADNAYIDLRFESGLKPLNASIPYQVIDESVWRFTLGEVGVGELGRFEVHVLLDCPLDDPDFLARAHCVEAHIFPDDWCATPSEFADLRVQGACLGDSLVCFTIKNVGTLPTPGVVDYIIIIDVVVRTDVQPQSVKGNLVISPGDSLTVCYRADGHTWRLETRQFEGYPGYPVAGATVEACTPPPGAPYSTGFYQLYGNGNAHPFIALDCRQAGESSKIGFPYGFGPEHCISPGQPLEYLITFKNTLPDTVRRVVVRDTLSPWIDRASVQPGAASAGYHVAMQPDGVLIWTMDSIALPPAAANPLLAQGFVKFKVRLNDTIPSGVEIVNRAAVAFDDHTPFFTDAVLHTTGAYCYQRGGAPQQPDCAIIEPNPSAADGVVHIRNRCDQNARIEHDKLYLTDACGRVLARDLVAAPEDGIDLAPFDLKSGCYFLIFVNPSNGSAISAAKLIIL